MQYTKEQIRVWIREGQAISPHVVEEILDHSSSQSEIEGQLRIAKMALAFIASKDLDDGDFHSMDQFELAEGCIAMANRAREALRLIEASDTLSVSALCPRSPV